MGSEYNCKCTCDMCKVSRRHAHEGWIVMIFISSLFLAVVTLGMYA